MNSFDVKLLGAFLLVLLAVTALNAVQKAEIKLSEGEEEFRLVPASSTEELARYVSEGTYYGTVRYTSALGGAAAGVLATMEVGSAASEEKVEAVEPARESTTNVRVAGIDEPDVLKVADGVAFFQSRGNVKSIRAFPPEEAEVLSKIPTNWGTNLLRAGDVLILLEGRNARGYDVSDPENPKEIWSIELNAAVRDAREKDGKIYLITYDYRMICPYYPVRGIVIPCARYYHPNIQTPTDETYTVLKIDGTSGKVENAIALTGSYQTTVYMSGNAIYFAYRIQKPAQEILYDFIIQEGEKFLPEDIVNHLRKVDGYDISMSAKIAEMEETLTKYYGSMAPEEASDAYSRIQKALEEYMRENAEKLDSTGIAKISLDDLSVEATGRVPGHLLNQWSMDEYEGYLRVATTTTVNWRDHLGNNIYVLDGHLKVVGQIEGLEEDERIYAVRFMGDKAYVVTYKETDPLLVLDLSDPTNPRVSGELKIPGYSTYLHPIDDTHMIGVGRGENWKIKVSLFDVADPENPKELDTYYLQEGWGEVLFNHHAFLWDKKHHLLIIPAGNRYYLLRVRTDEKPFITAVKIVEFDSTAKRAAYMDDYAYLFSDDEMVVVDENSGKEVKSLQIEEGFRVEPYPLPKQIPEPVD